MVAKRSRNGLAKSAKMAVDKWLDLPSDPLFKIFTKLNPIDMLLVVPLVCKNWGRILCEMLFYDNNNNSLNFRPLQHYAPFCSIFCGWGDDRSIRGNPNDCWWKAHNIFCLSWGNLFSSRNSLNISQTYEFELINLMYILCRL